MNKKVSIQKLNIETKLFMKVRKEYGGIDRFLTKWYNDIR